METLIEYLTLGAQYIGLGLFIFCLGAILYGFYLLIKEKFKNK